jgi:hypothetical protein
MKTAVIAPISPSGFGNVDLIFWSLKKFIFQTNTFYQPGNAYISVTTVVVQKQEVLQILSVYL